MNRKERRRQQKQARSGVGKTAPDKGETAGGPAPWPPPPASPVSGALLSHALGPSMPPAPARPSPSQPSPAAANPSALLRQAVHCFEEGRFGEAEPLLRRLLAQEPAQATALQLLGVVAFEAGRHEEGLDFVRRAIEARPDYAEAHHNLAMMLAAQGEADAALAHFGRAVALKPDYAEAHLNMGNLLRQSGRLEQARASYETALRRRPGFAEAHLNLANLLRELGRREEALAQYDAALGLRPDFADAHANKGHALRELGRQESAAAAYRRALELRPGDRETALSLREALSKLIADWHLPMLADLERNEAFEAAIRRAVAPGARVVDIGTGSGLLSMMAARAGAGSVTACEMLPLLAETAREIVAANGYGERIRVVPKKSTELTVGPGGDLDAPADLLIAEIFDNGLLGEGALPAFRHAVANLLKPDGRIIPAAATVHAMLVELPRLRCVNPPRDLHGFDLSLMDRFRNPAAYRRVDLAQELHRRLSEPFVAAAFDFRSPPQAERRRVLPIRLTGSGECQAVVFWFDLQLDEETLLSTAPGTALHHWGQAAQFFDEGRPVRKGEALELTVGHSDTLLFFDL